jgi:hypothetical protein
VLRDRRFVRRLGSRLNVKKKHFGTFFLKTETKNEKRKRRKEEKNKKKKKKKKKKKEKEIKNEKKIKRKRKRKRKKGNGTFVEFLECNGTGRFVGVWHRHQRDQRVLLVAKDLLLRGTSRRVG